jgi:dCTP diphosphatase
MAPPAASAADLGLRDLARQLSVFRDARDWRRHHTPRNLVLALVGEVGELSELFQWRTDDGAAPGLPDWTEADRVRLGEEVSDVLLYLVQLADVCGVDLATAVPRKIEMNGRKYPPLAGARDGAK